jgi:NDP-sugar pyrophosphorylase family protein
MFPSKETTGRFMTKSILCPGARMGIFQHPAKPFLDIDGKPMIHWVCEMFAPDDDFVLVVQKAHADHDKYGDILRSAARKVQVVPIEPNEFGPVVTALAADDFVDDQEPVIFSYCDFYQHWDYRKFLWSVAGADGGIATFRGFHPASFGDTYYAYLRINDEGDMLELREKRSFTDNRHQEPASSGVYYLRSWELFKMYANKIQEDGSMVGNEFYLSLLYNPMVQAGLKISTFEIDKFICWGTPEDVQQYRFWSNYFANDIENILARGK